MITEPPVHPPTMAELLTHTAGLTYGLFGATPVDKVYMAKNWFGAANLHVMTQCFAGIPLLYQPGSKWVYSVSMDIQGYIIEKLSGKPLPEFMEERIFKPLRMTDTAFFVPQEKRSRFATLYSGGPDGKLVVTGEASGPRADFVSLPGAPSGGGGLVSTARDYARFAQMLLNHGELDGARILSPATVDLMTSNHLSPRLLTGEFSIGKGGDAAGTWMGLRPCRVQRPARRRRDRRQRYILLGGGRRYLVLGRSGKRPCLCRNDPEDVRQRATADEPFQPPDGIRSPYKS